MVLFTQRLRRILRAEVPSHVEFYEEYLDLDRFPGTERLPQLARYFAESRDSDSTRSSPWDRSRSNSRTSALVHSFRACRSSSRLRMSSKSMSRRCRQTWQTRRGAARGDVGISSAPSAGPGARRRRRSLQNRLEWRGCHRSTLRGAGTAFALWCSRGIRAESLFATGRRLPRRSIVFVAYFSRDARGRNFYTVDLVSRLSRIAPVPVYGAQRNWIGEEIVGGAVRGAGGRRRTHRSTRAPCPAPAAG